MPLSLESRFCENVSILQCAGRIVLGDEVSSLEAALDQCARSSSQVVLSVRDVDRLDSIGLGLLVRYMTKLRKRGGDLRLADPQQFLLSLLDITMLSSVLQTHATEQDAILSFFKRPPTEKAPEKYGPRVLVVDSSADLCMFIRSVLLQHGFNVKSARLLRDARVLLQVDEVEYILVGPGTAPLSLEEAARSLSALAPKAVTLQLSPDFTSRTAQDAAAILLPMFGTSHSPARDS
jgi:anti-anti-sigma factor